METENLSGLSFFDSTNWDLHRKGNIDQQRHNEKVKEAIKENLPEIIAEESIITSDGKKLIKVPIRGIDLPEFRFDPRKRTQTGSGEGGSKKGDAIAIDPDAMGSKPGKGDVPGDTPGIDYYDAEIEVDELAALMFEDLGLPNLQQKKAETTEVISYEFNDIRKKGTMGNLAKRRMVMENIKRNALSGHAKLKDINDDDLRFRTYNEVVKKESNAVVLAMRDVSGSMGEFEKYITRSFYFWMVRFLRTKYNNVNIVFITHHTDAKEVDETNFFNLGESGGTRVSSAYKLAADLVDERYDPTAWNIYPFHFSDGDNYGDADNLRCINLVKERLLPVSNMFGYGEIREGGYSNQSTLMSAFTELKDEQKFVSTIIKKKEDVYPALKTFFKKDPLP